MTRHSHTQAPYGARICTRLRSDTTPLPGAYIGGPVHVIKLLAPLGCTAFPVTTGCSPAGGMYIHRLPGECPLLPRTGSSPGRSGIGCHVHDVSAETRICPQEA